METVTIVGLVAGTFSTLGFVPQVIKTWRTKQSRDLSTGTFSVLITGAALWLLYGTLTHDLPLIIANSISILLLSTMMSMMLWHRPRRSET